MNFLSTSTDMFSGGASRGGRKILGDFEETEQLYNYSEYPNELKAN